MEGKETDLGQGETPLSSESQGISQETLVSQGAAKAASETQEERNKDTEAGNNVTAAPEGGDDAFMVQVEVPTATEQEIETTLSIETSKESQEQTDIQPAVAQTEEQAEGASEAPGKELAELSEEQVTSEEAEYTAEGKMASSTTPDKQPEDTGGEDLEVVQTEGTVPSIVPPEEQVEDASMVQDDDTTDGTTAQDDGTAAQDDGTAILEDGTVVQGDGTTAQDDSTAAQDNGTVVQGDGTAQDDSTAAQDNGTAAQDDGTTHEERSTTQEPDTDQAPSIHAEAAEEKHATFAVTPPEIKLELHDETQSVAGEHYGMEEPSQLETASPNDACADEPEHCFHHPLVNGMQSILISDLTMAPFSLFRPCTGVTGTIWNSQYTIYQRETER